MAILPPKLREGDTIIISDMYKHPILRFLGKWYPQFNELRQFKIIKGFPAKEGVTK